MPADPKPRKRIVDPEAGKAKAEAEGRCRVCKLRSRPQWLGASAFTGLSRHHLVRRSQGGDDVDANMIPLCGGGTTGCHGLAERRHRNVLEKIRANLTPEEESYVLERKGEAWLDRHYPKGGKA